MTLLSEILNHKTISVQTLGIHLTCSPPFKNGLYDLCRRIIWLSLFVSLCWHGLGCLSVFWTDTSVRWPSPGPHVWGLGIAEEGSTNPKASPEERSPWTEFFHLSFTFPCVFSQLFCLFISVTVKSFYSRWSLHFVHAHFLYFFLLQTPPVSQRSEVTL